MIFNVEAMYIKKGNFFSFKHLPTFTQARTKKYLNMNSKTVSRIPVIILIFMMIIVQECTSEFIISQNAISKRQQRANTLQISNKRDATESSESHHSTGTWDPTDPNHRHI